MSIQLNPLLPTWLIVLLAGALLAAVVQGIVVLRIKQVPNRLANLLAGLRLAVLAVFVLMLLQPLISYSSSSTPLPELLILVDTSRSMAAPGLLGTRLDEVTGVLQKGELASALRSNHQLHWFSFDRSATPCEEKEIAALKGTGPTTRYADSIEAACNQARARGHHPQRLLLVSDGNDLGDADPVETARRLGLAVDVLAPAAAKSAENPAVAIIEVQSARRVLLGSETSFRVRVGGKHPASKDQSLTLLVTEDGKKILEHPFTMKAGRSEQTVLLTHRPAAAGMKQFEFRLEEGKHQTGKPYPLAVQVLDSSYEVLILEDRWRWEYKYLHRLFEDDPSFRFSALLARTGGAFVQFGSPDRRVNLVGFPQSRADLEGFDLFVLGDVNPSAWPRGLARDLSRMIADEGKSLVVVAGPGLAHLMAIPELHGLLPVELTADSGTPIEGPIEVRLRPDGASSPFFFQVRSADADKLPPLDQVYPTLRKRPGATVLLEAVKHRNAYGPVIVIAEQTVGRGRVLFLATDTLWKWHTLAPPGDGPTPYSIFWQQAFRAMTPPRSNVGAVNLWLTADRSRTEVARPILLRAEVQSSRPVPSSQLQAILTFPDGKRLPLDFSADPTNPRSLQCKFTCAEVGLHRISASLVAEGKVIAEGTTAIQVDESRGELGEGIDLANLTRIAQDTGGRVVDLQRPDSWPTAAESALPRVQQTHTLDLGGSFTLLLILCVLLGADWFIRLFRGLVAG
jgi:hypothetical protein